MVSDLFGEQAPDLDQQMREVRRELQQRERVYPRFVQAGKLTQKRADQQMRDLRAVLATLEASHAHGRVVDQVMANLDQAIDAAGIA